MTVEELMSQLKTCPPKAIIKMEVMSSGTSCLQGCLDKVSHVGDVVYLEEQL